MTIEALTQQLEALTKHGVEGMTDTQINEHRKQILALTKQCNKALGQTSTKQHNYDDAEVMAYIQQILVDGFNLVPTKLSTNSVFVDAQQLTWWKHIIKACVQQSAFSAEAFSIDYLSYQRSAIEGSSTLHELRQNVKAMIGPLTLYREFTAEPEPIQYVLTNEDMLIEEVEQLQQELAESKRVLSEITQLYNNSLLQKRDKQQTIDLVNAFKIEHNCSDDEACTVLAVSRSTLKRYRKEVAEDSASLV